MQLYQRKFHPSTNLLPMAQIISVWVGSLSQHSLGEGQEYAQDRWPVSHTHHIHSHADACSEAPVKLLCMFLDRERKLE